MSRSQRLPWAAALLGVSVLLFGVSRVSSQDKRVDLTKRSVIERPVQSIVANKSAAANPNLKVIKLPVLRDFSKSIVIEKQVSNLVKYASSQARATRPADGFVNPKVQPGKVRWHANLKAASAAAARSKKPVLLFQMMGRLDDQFC